MSAVKDDAAGRIKGLVVDIDNLAEMLTHCAMASSAGAAEIGAFETAARAARSIATDLDAVEVPQ